MDKRRTKVGKSRSSRGTTRGASPPSSRTRSKSPARVESSGRDSAPIKRGRPKKTDTPSEEISSSSQSSTPKKELKKTKSSPASASTLMDDSGDNEEVVAINTRSTRLASLRKRLSPDNYKITPTPSEDQKRSQSRSISLTKEDSEEEDEDSEEVEISSQPSGEEILGIFSKPLLVSGILLSLIFVPVVLQICFREPWKWVKVLNYLKSVESYYTKQFASLFLAFFSATLLLSICPIGKVVKLPGSDENQIFNGLFSSVVILAFLFGLELRGLDSLTAIYNNFDRFLMISVLESLILGSALYLRARKKPSINSNPRRGFINDFTKGLEVNPKILALFDIKKVYYHRSLIMILIINVALLFKNISIPSVETSSGLSFSDFIKESFGNFFFILRNSEYNSTSLVVSTLLVLYSLDLLVFEHHLATSFLINSEGCGTELLLRFSTFPTLLSFLPRFLLVQELTVNCYLLILIAVVFLTALWIKRCSECLKYEYRLRPSDTKFKDLVTLPTLQNHRLIISRWWSNIRQPNLLGEIVLHLILLVPLAVKFNWSAFIGIIFIVSYLIYRSIIINRKNARKYESSWDRYKQQVKYNLLPKIY